MQNLSFGLTLTVFGMGGTLLILLLISFIISGLNKFLIRGGGKREARKGD